jgi:hypothetical protein
MTEQSSDPHLLPSPAASADRVQGETETETACPPLTVGWVLRIEAALDFELHGDCRPQKLERNPYIRYEIADRSAGRRPPVLGFLNVRVVPCVHHYSETEMSDDKDVVGRRRGDRRCVRACVRGWPVVLLLFHIQVLSGHNFALPRGTTDLGLFVSRFTMNLERLVCVCVCVSPHSTLTRQAN